MATSQAKTTKAAAAKAAADTQDELVLLTAVEPIRHDGIDVAPEKNFATDPGSAAALLESGAARIADADAD